MSKKAARTATYRLCPICSNPGVSEFIVDKNVSDMIDGVVKDLQQVLPLGIVNTVEETLRRRLQ